MSMKIDPVSRILYLWDNIWEAMKTKAIYSPPSFEVVRLRMDGRICQSSPQQLINEMMLMETLTTEYGSWDDNDWD